MQSSSSQHRHNQAGKHFHWLALHSMVHMAGMMEWRHIAGKKHMHLCRHKCHMAQDQVPEEKELAGWELGWGRGWEALGHRRISADTPPRTL